MEKKKNERFSGIQMLRCKTVSNVFLMLKYKIYNKQNVLND